MRRHALAVLAFAVATFATQAASHFLVNAEHYATVAHIRKAPIFPLGIAAMLIEGMILTSVYTRMTGTGRSLGHALRFAWLVGGFLVSYTALAEAAKYTVPEVTSWIAIEVAAGFVQFTLYGLMLGWVHRNRVAAPKEALLEAPSANEL